MKVLAGVLLLACLSRAQVFEVGVHGGASRLSGSDLGTLRSGSTERLSLENGWRLGFRMTINQWAFFGQEFGYAYNRANWRQESVPPAEFGGAFHQGLYNFLAYGVPEGKAVRPFAAGGVHFSTYLIPGFSVSSGAGATKFGVNYGGGIKVRVSSMFGIRFDLRQYLNGKPFDFPGQSGKIRQIEASAGFSFIL